MGVGEHGAPKMTGPTVPCVGRPIGLTSGLADVEPGSAGLAPPLADGGRARGADEFPDLELHA